jgi:tetratricopeptide (TPR) repeat protein
MRAIFLLILFISIIGCNNTTKQQSEKNNQQMVIDMKALAKRANLFYEQNKYLQAITCYDSLISIDSTKGGYYYKRGYCKASLLNDPRGAIYDYKKAIECNYSEKNIAYLDLGVMYWIVLHRPDSAIYYYDECLKLDPTNKKAKIEKEAAMEDLKKMK